MSVLFRSYLQHFEIIATHHPKTRPMRHEAANRYNDGWKMHVPSAMRLSDMYGKSGKIPTRELVTCASVVPGVLSITHATISFPVKTA